MSIRLGLLALLQGGPRYGYQLRAEFEQLTGAAWPLNIGQVYTTLDRLERDGLAERDGDDGEGRVLYSLTEAGREAAQEWLTSPLARAVPPRNELAIKVALALSLPGVDAAKVIQTQRAASMKVLQEHTRARLDAAAAARPGDGAALLVLDSLIFAAEAEVRWLDHCEARMSQA